MGTRKVVLLEAPTMSGEQIERFREEAARAAGNTVSFVVLPEGFSVEAIFDAPQGVNPEPENDYRITLDECFPVKTIDAEGRETLTISKRSYEVSMETLKAIQELPMDRIRAIRGDVTEGVE